MQVGRSVRKKRSSKAKAVEQLAEETITFSYPVASFPLEGAAAGDGTRSPQKAGSKKQHQAGNTEHKAQDKQDIEDVEKSSGTKVIVLHLCFTS